VIDVGRGHTYLGLGLGNFMKMFETKIGEENNTWSIKDDSCACGVTWMLTYEHPFLLKTVETKT